MISLNIKEKVRSWNLKGGYEGTINDYRPKGLVFNSHGDLICAACDRELKLGSLLTD